jgi:hypothetical protein
MLMLDKRCLGMPNSDRQFELTKIFVRHTIAAR